MYEVKFIICMVFLVILSQSICFSQTTHKICDATTTNPCIVQDSKTKRVSVALLRDASMILSAYPGNTLGISNLFVSGSEEPSEQGWKEIAAYIINRKPKESSVVVLDLRQESHGYLNGKSITLTNQYNWINLGKTNEQSALDQQNWLKKLSGKAKVSGILTAEQFAAKEYTQGKNKSVKAIYNEEYMVNQLGFHYNHLYVSDHRAPLDSEVDELVKIVKNKPNNTWFHIHCRAGKGRTTTFFALLDMLKNADQVSMQEIIARQASIPPFYNLFEINRSDPNLTKYYFERLLFLEQFYQFAQQSLAGNTGTWSEWKKINSPT